MKDLRDFIELLRAKGQLRVIETPVDPVLEIAEIADRVVKAGVRAILNFAPVRPVTPPGVYVRQVDLSSELMVLSFQLNAEDARR